MLKSKELTFNICGTEVPLNKMTNEHFVDYIRIVLGLPPMNDDTRGRKKNVDCDEEPESDRPAD